MNSEADTEHIYVYRIGPFTLGFAILLASLSAYSGLHLIARTVVKGAFEDLILSVLAGHVFMLVAALLFRWLYKDYVSSQSIVLCKNKVQRPMTKGTSDGDFLSLNEVVGTAFDESDNDNGPAFIVETKTKPVVYKSMYFDQYGSFEEFCSRLEDTLVADNF